MFRGNVVADPTTPSAPSLARRSQPSVGVNLATLSAAKKPVSGTQKIISISKKLVFIMEMIFPTTKTIVSMNEKTDFVPEKIFPGTTSIGSRLKMIFFVFEKIFFTLETSFSGFEKIILRREKIFFVVKKIFSEATSANSLIRRAW